MAGAEHAAEHVEHAEAAEAVAEEAVAVAEEAGAEEAGVEEAVGAEMTAEAATGRAEELVVQQARTPVETGCVGPRCSTPPQRCSSPLMALSPRSRAEPAAYKRRFPECRLSPGSRQHSQQHPTTELPSPSSVMVALRSSAPPATDTSPPSISEQPA